VTVNIRDYYFHSIIQDYENTKVRMEAILNTGGVIAPPTIGELKRYGCHSDNQICISKYTEISPDKLKLYLSCFNLYLSKFTTILINKSFADNHIITKPKLATNRELYMQDLLNKGTHTNIYDEYRTTDMITMDYFEGVCIPCDKLINDAGMFVIFFSDVFFDMFLKGEVSARIIDMIRHDKNNEEDANERRKFIEQYILDLKELFGKYNFDMPIYNFTEGKELVLKA
jgi:hypothetical protein